MASAPASGGYTSSQEEVAFAIRPTVGLRDVYDSQGAHHVTSRGLEVSVESIEARAGIVLGYARAQIDTPSDPTTPDWLDTEIYFGPRLSPWVITNKLHMFVGAGLAYTSGSLELHGASHDFRRSDTTYAGYGEVGLELHPFSHVVITLIGRSLWSNTLEVSNSKLDPSYNQASLGVGVEF
jgi:hypothetical protein